jgi:hypothetical protein
MLWLFIRLMPLWERDMDSELLTFLTFIATPLVVLLISISILYQFIKILASFKTSRLVFLLPLVFLLDCIINPFNVDFEDTFYGEVELSYFAHTGDLTAAHLEFREYNRLEVIDIALMFSDITRFKYTRKGDTIFVDENLKEHYLDGDTLFVRSDTLQIIKNGSLINTEFYLRKASE